MKPKDMIFVVSYSSLLLIFMLAYIFDFPFPLLIAIVATYLGGTAIGTVFAYWVIRSKTDQEELT